MIASLYLSGLDDGTVTRSTSIAIPCLKRPDQAPWCKQSIPDSKSVCAESNPEGTIYFLIRL